MCSGPQVQTDHTSASAGAKVSDTNYSAELAKYTQMASGTGLNAMFAKMKLQSLQMGNTVPQTPAPSGTLATRVTGHGTGAADLIMPTITVPRG